MGHNYMHTYIIIYMFLAYWVCHIYVGPLAGMAIVASILPSIREHRQGRRRLPQADNDPGHDLNLTRFSNNTPDDTIEAES